MKSAYIVETKEAEPRYYYQLVSKGRITVSKRFYKNASATEKAIKRNHPEFTVIK